MSDLWHIRRNTAATYSLYAATAVIPFSVLLCHVALLIFLLLWIFEKDLLKNIRAARDNYQLLALIGFALILLISVSYSENKSEAWFTVEKKAFFFLIPIAFATSSTGSPKFSKNLFIIFCWSCFTALAVCYVQAFQRVQLFHAGQLGAESINYLSSSEFWNPGNGTAKEWMFFSYLGLSSGVNMHPTYLSMYAAFCSIVLVHEFVVGNMNRMQRVVNFLLLAFFSCSIVLLSARIVLIVLAILYTGFFFYQVARTKRKVTTGLALFAFGIALIAGIFINPVTRYRQVDEIVLSGFTVSTNKNYNNSTGIRASLWWLSVQAYLNSNPMLGVGTGDVEDAVEVMSERFGITNVLNSYSPHNEYLQILLAMGIPGLLFFSIYIGIALVKAWRNRDIIFLNFLLLFLTVCLTESALELQKGIVCFSIFFSCMSFQKKEAEEITVPLNVPRVASQIR